MPDYYIYCIDEHNRVVSRHDHTAPDDEAALEKARELCGEHEVEAWRGTQIIARLGKDGARSLQTLGGRRPR